MVIEKCLKLDNIEEIQNVLAEADKDILIQELSSLSGGLLGECNNLDFTQLELSLDKKIIKGVRGSALSTFGNKDRKSSVRIITDCENVCNALKKEGFGILYKKGDGILAAAILQRKKNSSIEKSRKALFI